MKWDKPQKSHNSDTNPWAMSVGDMLANLVMKLKYLCTLSSFLLFLFLVLRDNKIQFGISLPTRLAHHSVRLALVIRNCFLWALKTYNIIEVKVHPFRQRMKQSNVKKHQRIWAVFSIQSNLRGKDDEYPNIKSTNTSLKYHWRL